MRTKCLLNVILSSKNTNLPEREQPLCRIHSSTLQHTVMPKLTFTEQVWGPGAEADAEAWLMQWTDGGAMPSAMWKTCRGGHKGQRLFQCSAHVGCTVKVCMRQVQAGSIMWIVKKNEEAHAEELNTRKRKNSICPAAFEEEARRAFVTYRVMPVQVYCCKDAPLEFKSAW